MQMLIGTLSMNISQKLTHLNNGVELKKQIENGNMDELDMAEEEINRQDAIYHENVGKKWIFLIVGFIVVGVLGFFAMPKIHGLKHSSYDRTGIESLCDKLFGKVQISEALTKEVAIVAYDYTSH